MVRESSGKGIIDAVMVHALLRSAGRLRVLWTGEQIHMMRKIIALLCIFSFLFANNIYLLNNLMTQSPNDSMINDKITNADEVAQALDDSDEMTDDLMTPVDSVYSIETGDVLEIVILGEEELSRTLMVMHNGTISFPLIGEVKVAGLTTEQAGDLLVEKLKKYFTHPVVSVILKSPTLPSVSVFGEVMRSGAVDYQRGLRVTDYIALAGGPTNKANLKKVKIVRFVDGKPTAETINVDDILRKGRTGKNYELKSGDWLYISKKFTINWSVVLSTLSLAVAILNLYFTIERTSN